MSNRFFNSFFIFYFIYFVSYTVFLSLSLVFYGFHYGVKSLICVFAFYFAPLIFYFLSLQFFRFLLEDYKKWACGAFVIATLIGIAANFFAAYLL